MWKRIIVFLIGSLVLLAAHKGIVWGAGVAEYKLYGMHIFLFVIGAVGLTIMELIFGVNPNKVGFTFLGFSTLKIMASFAFLYLSKPEGVLVKNYIIQFMLAYFAYLIFEVYLVAKLLFSVGNTPKTEG